MATTTKKEVTEELEKKPAPPVGATSTAIKSPKTDNIDAKLEKLTDLMATFMQGVMINQANQTVAQQSVESLHGGKIKIVHLAQMDPQLGTIIHLSNLDVGMTNFGEERLLTIQQFEELLSKHRSWFTKGLLCVAKGYEEEARTYGVTTVDECPIDSIFVKTLGDVPMTKIEEVYNRLPEYGQENLVSYWLRCAYEGNPKFRDIRRVKTFNDITGGKLENFLVELNRKVESGVQQGTRPNIVRY